MSDVTRTVPLSFSTGVPTSCANGNPRCPDPTKPVSGTFKTFTDGGVDLLPIPPETPAT